MSTEAETTSATTTVLTPTKEAVKDATKAGSAPTTPSKETDEALTQLVQGRRHLLVKDYFSAVAALAKACELLAVKYGDTAPECGDAYLTYGRALLELARSESGVLGMNEGEKSDEDADGEAEGEEDGEGEGEEDEEEESGEAVAESAEAESKETEEAKEEKVNGGKENGDHVENGEKKTENGEKAAENGEEKAEGEEGDQKEEEEEDVNNLQLAWEMLELAKVIFQKQLEAGEDSQTFLKLAEVYLKLGEVGVESENYNTAVEDMKSCLELQRKYLEDDDRRIAETLYNMGMAYSLANEFDSAIEQFKAASEQIEKRIGTLEKKKGEPASENKDVQDDPFYTVQGEIDELKALLPEMKEKVSDMQDFKKETVRRMMDGLAEKSARESSTADGAGPSSASDKPVSSVAHLVKRKPKDEVKESSEAAETKPEVKTSSVAAETSENSEVKESLETDAEGKETSPNDRKRKPEVSELEDASKKVKIDDSEKSSD